jgi:GTP-binding protein Era
MASLEIPDGHRSGFVALAGRPNVGKSTLINRLLGQRIAAVSPKPQTTRQRQLGILTLPDAQLIFVDTPGLHEPLHKLGEKMNEEALSSLHDADVVLALFDLTRPPNEEDRLVAAQVREIQGQIPTLIALTKVDRVPDDRLSDRRAAFRTMLPEADFLEISATRGDNLEELVTLILDKLPEGSRLFPPETITDAYERDIAADMIRAAALKNLRNEVPHSLAIRIDEFEERNEHGAYIEATIFVERDSQKGIVIGKGGSMLKTIGTFARMEIEAATDRKIFLRLRVKVLPGWRNDENKLKSFGFGGSGP